MSELIAIKEVNGKLSEMWVLECSCELLDVEMQLNPAMIQGEVNYPCGLGSFHFYDYLPEDGLQFI